MWPFSRKKQVETDAGEDTAIDPIAWFVFEDRCRLFNLVPPKPSDDFAKFEAVADHYASQPIRVPIRIFWGNLAYWFTYPNDCAALRLTKQQREELKRLHPR